MGFDIMSRCVTHDKIFGKSRTGLTKRSKSVEYAGICFDCEKAITKFHFTERRPGRYYAKPPIEIKIKN
jgi:hypothetical protein